MKSKNDFLDMFDELSELSKEMNYTYPRGIKGLSIPDEYDFNEIFKELFVDIGKMAEEVGAKPPSSRLEIETIMMRNMKLFPKVQMHVDILESGIRLMHNWTILREWDHQRSGVIALFFEDIETMYLTQDEKALMTDYFKSQRTAQRTK